MSEKTACVSEKVCMSETPCVEEMARMGEMACMKEILRVEETACVSDMASVSEKECVTEARCVSERPCVSGTARVSEMACVSERLSGRETACVRSLCAREMAVGMREHATACPGVNVMSRCVSVVARGSLCARVRRRRRQMDKGRVAAVAVLGTAPGLHGSEREVRAVLRTRPPRARLRE